MKILELSQALGQILKFLHFNIIWKNLLLLYSSDKYILVWRLPFSFRYFQMYKKSRIKNKCCLLFWSEQGQWGFALSKIRKEIFVQLIQFLITWLYSRLVYYKQIFEEKKFPYQIFEWTGPIHFDCANIQFQTHYICMQGGVQKLCKKISAIRAP